MNVRLVANPSYVTPCNRDGVRVFTEKGQEITLVRGIAYRSSLDRAPTLEIEIIDPAVELDVTAEAEFVGPSVRVLLDALGLGGCETIGEAKQFLKNSGVSLTMQRV